MNGDQKGRARKMVAVLSSFVAPALSGALCAAFGCVRGKETSRDFFIDARMRTLHNEE